MLVPLPRQATLILNEMWALRRAESPYVFPGHRNPKRPMTTAAMSNAMLELGLRDDQKVHGFRATARTILVERLGISEPVVEMQLGHAVKDGNGRAYNRTTWLEQRREMLQMWADFLDDLRARSL
jgi:integrase